MNNGNQPLKPVNPNVNASATTLAQIQPAFATGQAVPGYFVSESGATTMSSFESMSATLSQENWGMHVRPATSSLPAPFCTPSMRQAQLLPSFSKDAVYVPVENTVNE